MSKVETEIQFTEKNALITQTGFFGKNLSMVCIPLEQLNKMSEILLEMYVKWQNELMNNETQTHLFYELKISEKRIIEFEEVIVNERLRDKDMFGIYDHEIDLIFDTNALIRSIYFRINSAYILSCLLMNRQNFSMNWELN